ncbi:MAG: F0F1 ATP synthase subunit A [Dehalococcoidia bacterium]|nr:F0F1 ATP synthase subunit A [Dehalococcoidia bacterium]
MKLWGIVLAALVVTVVGFIVFPSPKTNIIIAAEPIATVAGFPITNTMVASWVTILFWAIFGFAATRNLQMIPRGLQNLFEAILEFLLNTAKTVAGEQNGRRFFPFVACLFLFIVTANWFALVPGFTTIGVLKPHEAVEGSTNKPFYLTQVAPGVFIVPFGPQPAPKDDAAKAALKAQGWVAADFVPILRPANTDLNMTLVLGLMAFLMIEFWGMRALGVGGYLSKFFVPPWKDPIGTILGIIELFAEFARIASFALRLFGNIFAGKVLVGVIAFLAPLVLVLPFFGLELFIGFIQGAVFGMLVLVFGSLAVMEHGHGDEHHDHASAHSHATAAGHGGEMTPQVAHPITQGANPH